MLTLFQTCSQQKENGEHILINFNFRKQSYEFKKGVRYPGEIHENNFARIEKFVHNLNIFINKERIALKWLDYLSYIFLLILFLGTIGEVLIVQYNFQSTNSEEMGIVLLIPRLADRKSVV